MGGWNLGLPDVWAFCPSWVGWLGRSPPVTAAPVDTRGLTFTIAVMLLDVGCWGPSLANSVQLPTEQESEMCGVNV